MFLSVVIPLIKIPIYNPVSDISSAIIIDEIVVTSSGQQTLTVANNTPDIITIIYLAIVAILFIRIVFGVFSILRIKRKSKRVVISNYRIYASRSELSPFSIFNNVFINEKELSEDDSINQIIAHEKTHISQYHSVDIIFSELTCVMLWINPFFWIIKYNLKSTHEYLADEKVMEQGFEPAGYFMLLFSNVVGIRIGLANNLNQSLTLKRMKMMKKERSPRWMRLAYLLALPFVAAIVFAFSFTDAGASLNSDLKNVNFAMDDTIKSSVEGEIYEEVDVMPIYGNGQEDLVNFIVKEVNYPEQAKKNGIQGKVFISYVVTSTGKVADVEVLESVNDLLDAEAVRVVSSMKKWSPGKKDGKAVNVKMVMPIMFKLN
jgi:TonB family protein